MKYKHILLCGGIGSRLRDEYNLDKPFNLIKGIPLLTRNIECLPSNNILIIAGSHLIKYQLDTIIHHITKKKVEVIFLDRPTRGPVETAFLGLKKSTNIVEEDALIFYDNDTLYEGINIPDEKSTSIGYLTLKDKNKNHPYCFLKIENGFIKSIHEKEQVSNQYAAGIYSFKSKQYFQTKAYELIKNEPNEELFMSKLYKNLLISGESIKSFEVKDGICLGTIEDINRNINKVTSKRLRICFDLDNTILKYRFPGEEYSDCKPIQENLDLLKKLHQDGHTIIIHTARGMATAKQNEGSAMKRVGKDTFDVLEKYKIPFDEIYFGKPNADLYIDDKAHNPFEDIYSSIGFPQLRPKVTNSTNKYNTMTFSRNYVIKEGPVNSMKGEIHFYESISNLNISNYFPKYLHSEISRDKAYLKLEKIHGFALFDILSDGLMDKSHIEKIFDAFEDIHNTKTEIIINSEKIYENYLGKLEKRIISDSDYPYSNKYEIVKLIKPEIKRYLNSVDFKIKDVIHGDPWFSNTMIDINSNIKFLDMKGDVAGNLTTNGDELTDYAKIYQSLLGFDYIVNNLTPNIDILNPLQEHFLKLLEEKNYDLKILKSITICMVAKTISFFEEDSPHKKLIWEIVENLSTELN